jgi:hypothetical protein
MTKYTRTSQTPAHCTIKSITVSDFRVTLESVKGEIVPLRMIGLWGKKYQWVMKTVELFKFQQI